jgi:hypothetical protein
MWCGRVSSKIGELPARLTRTGRSAIISVSSAVARTRSDVEDL